MALSLVQITQDILVTMQAILDRSAGYSVSLDDEIRYYDAANSRGWIVARDDNGRDVGFIRSFVRGSRWSQAEFFVDPQVPNRAHVAQQILAAFRERSDFSPGHRLRLDVHANDLILNAAVQSEGFSKREQRFYHYDLVVLKKKVAQGAFARLGDEHAQDVAEVLSHLQPVTEAEALVWIRNGNLRAVSTDGRLASVAQLNFYDNSIEISRLATHAHVSRQGAATRLFELISEEAFENQKPRVFLKVESLRTPAITFYKKFGFSENPDKAEIWHSSWF